MALAHGPWGGRPCLGGEAEGSEGTAPAPELTDAGTEAQGGAMACPRTDSGLVEPHLWVPRPPGLPINAGVRLSLEGTASTLNGPSAGLHTCPSPPPASTPPHCAPRGAEQEVASSERRQAGYSGCNMMARVAPLVPGQTVREDQQAHQDPPAPWTASGLLGPARLPRGHGPQGAWPLPATCPNASGCRNLLHATLSNEDLGSWQCRWEADV